MPVATFAILHVCNYSKTVLDVSFKGYFIYFYDRVIITMKI